MAINPKYVVKAPQVILDPDARSIDISTYVKDFSPGLTRKEIDVAAYGDSGKAVKKGSAEHDVKFDFYQSDDFTVFTNVILAELTTDNDTVFKVLPHAGVAVSASNPSFKMAVSVTKLGSLLGERDKPGQFNGQWTVQNNVQVSFDGVTWTNI